MLKVPPRVTAFTGSGVDPVTSSASGYLWWLIKQTRGYLALNTLTGLFWMIPAALSPWLLGQVIDKGIVPGDRAAVFEWAGLLLVTVTIGVLGGIAMHTTAVLGWIQTIYRTQRLVVRKATQLGHVLPRRTPTGEVMSVASSDAGTYGAMIEVLGRGIAAVVSYLVVAVIVIGESWKLGLVVLIAAPLMVGATSPLTRPFHAATTVERGRSSKLTGMATDIVAGLRILRGIGGEQTFGDNYARQSQSVRQAGVRAGLWMAAIDSVSTMLTGFLLVLLTYLGAMELIAGNLAVGQLISFFGYAFFLVNPMRTFFECILKWVAALVAADRTRAVLGESVPWRAGSGTQALPSNAPIVDVASGFVAQPGEFTVVVSASPDESSALADRLGRYLPTVTDVPDADVDESLKGRKARAARADKLAVRAALADRDSALAEGSWGVEVGGVDLSQVPLGEVREAILVSDANASLFAGTLQQALDPHGIASRETAEAAMRAASAEDVYDGLPLGWQSELEEKGRALSGGQRQRIVLARALVADPEVLVLVEPTSAVDAHTEARIASRLAGARSGRTTIVMTASPLLLREAQSVVFLVDGVVRASGTHHELFATNADYRQVVRRGMEADE